MKNYLLYALGLLLWMGGLGCGLDEAVAPVMEEGRTARVSLSLGMEPMTGTTTRALAPHIPEVENLINDVWVVQFNSRGQRLTLSNPYDDRGEAAGLYIDNYQVDLVAATNSTVCLVVNTGDPAISWPDNLPGFQQMLLDIKASNDLSQRDRIPMCGYWVGDVTDGMSLSVQQRDRRRAERPDRRAGQRADGGVRLPRHQPADVAPGRLSGYVVHR